MSLIDNYNRSKNRKRRYRSDKDIVERWLEEHKKIANKFFAEIYKELNKEKIEEEITKEIVKQIEKTCE